MRCPGTAPDGAQCPWDALPGAGHCQFHTAPAPAVVEQRRTRAELARSIAETQRKIEAMLPPPAELDRMIREEREQEKQARRDAWHARRREQEAERQARREEARKAAQIAIQDPETRQVCRVCKRSLPLDGFHRDRAALLGRMTHCRDCQAAYDRERRSKR